MRLNPANSLQQWASHQVRQISARRVAGASQLAGRKLLLVHLDGVPRTLLQEGIAQGWLPFLSQWVGSGRAWFEPAFWGSPASTPAFQAGLLYGLRHPNLPAYGWFDRLLGRRVQMNVPKDAQAIEQRLSEQAPLQLLQPRGRTYFSLFRGGAQNHLCMSTLADVRTMARQWTAETEGLLSARSRGTWEYVRSLGEAAWQSQKEGRAWSTALHDSRHEAAFFLSRVLLQRLGWSFAHAKTQVDLVAGAPIVYLVFGNYDEVAHRRGPRSPLALEELQRADHDLAELCAMASEVSPPYDVIFLTDHGHVASAPWERLSGKRFAADLQKGAVAPPLSASLQEALLQGQTPWVARPTSLEVPVVVEAGNFAHLYLSPREQPYDAREILRDAPELLARTVHHPDIGVVALRRGASAVALIEGQAFPAEELPRAPLAVAFNVHALKDLLDELPFMPNAGDLVLFGQARAREETVGFTWEFGSHGGLTHAETDSVICWPKDAPLDLRGLTHSSQLHQRLAEVYHG